MKTLGLESCYRSSHSSPPHAAPLRVVGLFNSKALLRTLMVTGNPNSIIALPYTQGFFLF